MNTQNTLNQFAILTPEQIKNLVTQIIEETKNTTKEQNQSDELLTSKEVQKILKVNNSTMHRYINEGKLKPIRFGRKLLFKKSELIKWAKKK